MVPRTRSALVALLALAQGLPTSPARAEGKYTRRQRARGEVTDTAPKLDRYAFINDEAPEPRRLVLVVDTWVARLPRDPRFLPLVVALSYEGTGPALPIRPERFVLTWEGADAPLAALDQEALLAAADGTSPVLQDMRLLSRRVPLAFDTPRAQQVAVQFYSHPALRTFRHDRLDLPSRRWFSTLAYFPVPEGFDRWGALFELRYVAADGAEPLVACRFRVQRDPALASGSMRRARKDLQTEHGQR